MADKVLAGGQDSNLVTLLPGDAVEFHHRINIALNGLLK